MVKITFVVSKCVVNDKIAMVDFWVNHLGFSVALTHLIPNGDFQKINSCWSKSVSKIPFSCSVLSDSKEEYDSEEVSTQMWDLDFVVDFDV